MTDQPLIVRRIDAALAKMDQRKMAPRAIYLTPADYRALAKARTKAWREATGSKASVEPLSYEDIPIINRAAFPAIPVRQTASAKRCSVIFSNRGVEVCIPVKVD